MKFNELKIDARKKYTRAGRGISAGRGKTAGRGTKGQNARSGTGGGRQGYSGRKDALMRRIPKLPGFTSHRIPAVEVFTSDLDTIKAKKIDATVVAEAGLAPNAFVSIKLISDGKLEGAKDVKLPYASKGAVELLQKAGGSFEKVERLKRPSKVQDK